MIGTARSPVDLPAGGSWRPWLSTSSVRIVAFRFHPQRTGHPVMILRIVLIAAVLAAATSLRAETYLVEDGKPRAAIVIAENAARSTLLAADELRATIETISGATLPIETT